MENDDPQEEFEESLDEPGDKLVEQFFSCPYCWQTISMMLDLSAENQSYIEDCEKCCAPIEISFTTDGSAVSDFSAEKAQ